jgi:hypothetical protein
MVTWGLVYHAVLAERRPLEATARPAREVHSWCGLFRKCLDAVALATGFISSMRRSPPLCPVHDLDDPADDPGRHADAGDLADPRLRRGRPAPPKRSLPTQV